LGGALAGGLGAGLDAGRGVGAGRGAEAAGWLGEGIAWTVAPHIASTPARASHPQRNR